MAKFTVTIEQTIEVELDESKFTSDFMAEFRHSFYPFETLQEHAEHIAQLQARGIIDLEGYVSPREFIEGYGPPSEMGIKVLSASLDFL